MTVSAIDSAVYGNLFTTAAMRAAFGDEARLQRMLDVEAALARAEAEVGLIPAAAAAEITAKAEAGPVRSRRDPGRHRARRLSDRAAGQGAGRGLRGGCRPLRPLGRHHPGHRRYGARAADRATGLALIGRRSGRHRGRAGRARAAPSRHADGRAHPSAARAADHLRLQVRGLARRHPAPAGQARRACARRFCVVQFGGAVGTLASLGADGIRVMEALAAELEPAGADDRLARRPRRPRRGGELPRRADRQPRQDRDRRHAADADRGRRGRASPTCTGRGGSSTMPQKRNPIACEFDPRRGQERPPAGAGDARCHARRPRARDRPLARRVDRAAAGLRADRRRAAPRPRHARGARGRSGAHAAQSRR